MPARRRAEGPGAWAQGVPAVLPLMQFTNVITEQPLTSADSMQADGLATTSG